MKFLSQDTVSDAFGPKAYDPTKTVNWAPTRYVPWSSWAVATNIWPNASGNNSTEAESSGMAVYAHELSHNLSIPDNYNNPFAAIQQRTASGMWDMMSRGSFNGPGGQHTRFQIPPTQGGALGAQHNLRNKRFLNFIGDGDILRLNRDGLAQSGIAVAEVKAREVAPNGDLAGVRVLLNGGDKNPPCRYHTNPTCEGPWYTTATGTNVTPGFNDYTMEVVQQVGSDSYSPGHGVLIGKSKNSNSSCGSFNCFVWYIDSNPQDINQVDYLKADGTPVKATVGDERQTNDGSFNVGLNSGSTYEYKAENNRLHFYVINKRTDADGMLRYTVAVRSLDGAGPQTRGVSVGAATKGTDEGCRPARSRSRTRARRRRRTRRCTRRTRTRSSAATSTACRPALPARAGRRTSRTRSPPRSSARPSRCRSTSTRPRARPRRARSRSTRRPRATRRRRCRSTARSARATPSAAPSRRRSR